MATKDKELQYKRKFRNYLLDVGLQLRYTVFIIAIAVFLTAFLGYRIYEATRESSRIVIMTASVEPGVSQELLSQFKAKDRIVLFGIFGFGVVLVLTVTGAGIWMTHKIAGPLHNIGMAFARVRDNRLPPELGHLRKGDELQAFHAAFREMYEAICARVGKDVEVLGKTITTLKAQKDRSPELEEMLQALESLNAEKRKSLELPE
jgi:hypothetical protein